MNQADLLGPLAGLALAIVFLGLFYTGKILPRNAVPREDYEKVMEINHDYSLAIKDLSNSVDRLILVVEYQQRSGGSGVPTQKNR